MNGSLDWGGSQSYVDFGVVRMGWDRQIKGIFID